MTRHPRRFLFPTHFLLAGVALLLAAACTPGRAGTWIFSSPEPVPTGTEIYEEMLPLDRAGREALALHLFSRGAVPERFMTFRDVPIPDPDNPSTIRGTLRVTADYFALGTDEDFLRLPVSAPTAQQIADRAGCLLPTRRIVDLIDQAADAKVAPRPFSPDFYEIDTLPVFRLSHLAIEDQLRGRTGTPLVSGIKKDIVVTNLLSQRPPPPRVAIYGWHRLNGTAIQPLSLVHGAYYADYSHGVRLISREVTIDGETHDLEDVLQDPELAPLVSDEGVLTVLRYPGAG